METRRKANPGFSRRRLVRGAAAAGMGAVGLAVLAGCGETQVVEKEVVKVVTKEVPVERIVTKEVIKEVPVEKIVTKEVEKIVTQIVEKIVTAPPAPAKPKTVTLTWLQIGGGVFDERTKLALEIFKKQVPNITINTVQAAGAAIAVQQKLLLMLAGGTPPDVFFTHTYTNPAVVKRNVPLALDELIKADAKFKLDDYFAGAIEDFRVAKKLYALPFITTSVVLVYNVELFEKAKVDPPKADWSWAEYREAGKKLTSGSGTSKTFGTGNWNANAYTMTRMWQAGGDVLDESRAKYIGDTPAAVAGVQAVADLIHVDKSLAFGAELGDQNLTDAFLTGRVGTFANISDFFVIAGAKFKWDIQHLPQKGDKKVTRNASAGYSAWAGTKEPEAAWELVKILDGRDMLIAWLATNNSVPPIKDVAAGPEHLDPKRPPASKQVFIDAFAYSRPESIAGDWIGIHREFKSATDTIFGPQKADAKTAMTSVKERIEKLAAQGAQFGD